jgi:hypothetical protein
LAAQFVSTNASAKNIGMLFAIATACRKKV